MLTSFPADSWGIFRFAASCSDRAGRRRAVQIKTLAPSVLFSGNASIRVPAWGGLGVAGETFSKDWEFVFRVLPAAVFLCLPDREKETSNQMHMKSLTSTFSGQRSKMKRDLPGDCVLKETLLKGKDGSRWCDVTLDSRSQKSMLCKGRNNNLMYTDGGVASGLLRELKHESGSMQILGDLETNQHICIFSPPSKRKCSALSIRGGLVRSI